MSRMGSNNGGRRTRRQFSDEFKEGALRQVPDEGKTMGAVPRELDLMASALGLVGAAGPRRAHEGQEWTGRHDGDAQQPSISGLRPWQTSYWIIAVR
jgi:hypothetical protein